MDRCISESWVRWWCGFGSVEIGELPMSLMMGRSRLLMMGWMWCNVGGVNLVAPWVKWFRRSRFCAFVDLGFVWVLCVFCSEAWIDFYLLGSDGLDVVVIWWFFFSLICVFGSSGILVGSGHGGVVGMVVVVW